MSRDTVKSLTKKGWSQKKIALKLRLRKTKVVAEQRRLKIGKRTKGGAMEFWRDVASIKEIEQISRKEATKRVKYSPKWYKRRQKKLTGFAKGRDAMLKGWHDVRTGKISKKEMLEMIEEDDERMLSEAGYD